MRRAIALLSLCMLFVAPASRATAAETTSQTVSNGSVSMTLPQTVEVGRKPLKLVVAIHNWTKKEISFDGIVEHGGPAWGFMFDKPQTTQNSEVYNTSCPPMQNFCMWWWKGTLSPGDQAEFHLPTVSGERTGRFVTSSLWLITTIPNEELIEGRAGLTVVARQPN